MSGTDGTAIYYALHLDELNTWIAQLCRTNCGCLALTLYVWWLELIGPLLMFSPVFDYRCVSR